MISSVTLRFLYALVSHLCLTELPEVTMPYSDMWQDCQITFPYTRPCYAKSSYRLVDPPDPSWKRPPRRPRTRWTDQLRRDNSNVPIATLWRQAIGRGHSRATLRSEPTTRYRRRRRVYSLESQVASGAAGRANVMLYPAPSFTF